MELEALGNKRKFSLEVVMTYIFYLFVMSLLTSKAGINIFGGIFAFLGIINIFIKYTKVEIVDYFKKNKIIFLMVGIYFLGIITNLISEGGTKSLGKYAGRHTYFLIIPCFLLMKNKISIKKIFSLFLISFIIAEIKSYEVFANEFNFQLLDTNARVHSFYDYGRWSALLLFNLCYLLPLIFEKKLDRYQKYLVNISFILGLISLILSNSRGPWLMFIVINIVYFLLYKRKMIKYFIAFFSLIVLVLTFSNDKYTKIFRERVRSIKETKENNSNYARINMWREGLDFTKNNLGNKRILVGTGLLNYEKPFSDYLIKKGNYQELFEITGSQFSYTDSHSIYLNLLNQMGLLYFLTYLYLIFLILKNLILSKEKNEWTIPNITMVISFLLLGIFYSYVTTYEMHTFYILYLLYYSRKGNTLIEN